MVDLHGERFQFNCMMSPIAIFIRSNRTFFAVAMLCLLAMKGFGFLGMASAVGKPIDGLDRSFALAIIGAHCDQHQENGLPQGTHAHHTECCVLCSGGAREAALIDVVSVGVVVAFLTPRLEKRPIIASFYRHDPPLAYSSGLFSDWSPTAPPLV